MGIGWSGGSSLDGIVRVKWLSRTAGFQADESVESIIQAASEYFHLDALYPDLVLLWEREGEEMEVTNGILGLLPKDTILTLSLIERGNGPHQPRRPLVDEEEEALHREIQDHACPDNLPTTDRIYLPPLPSHTGMFVWVMTLTGETFEIRCKRRDTVASLQSKIQQKEGTPHDQQLITFAGQQLEKNRKLSDYNIQRESIIHLMPRNLRIGKPVIYLFPPNPIPDATVSVSIVPQWSFSHVYPLAAPKRLEGGQQRIDWSVSAQPDGTLVEKDTRLELSYLFWEADTNASLPPSPPLGPADAHSEYFDPAYPALYHDTPTVVLLPFAELLPYLDSALKTLSLHTAARNDFITYWLPKLGKKPFVALRFLPQAAYERAAALEVQPAPEVVTRVFMLFRGIAAEDAKHPTWSTARARVGEVDWANVVGVEAGAWDDGRFRVLEWGAMEVL